MSCGVRVQRRRHLRRELSHVVEKIADAPHEDPRVPEIAVASHHLGAGAIRLLDEARHATHAGLEFLARLDVAEARVGARRHDADRHQHVVLLGHVGGARQGADETRPDRRSTQSA